MQDPFNHLPLAQLFTELNPRDELNALIETAKREDTAEAGDVTTLCAIAPGATAEAGIWSRSPGTVCGLPLLPLIAKAYDEELTVTLAATDGVPVKAGEMVAAVSGSLRSILTAERVMLNFVCYLSGIASLTARYVEAAEDTPTRIFDTRKTLPGTRGLAKYAVRAGGGFCHRIGLYDAMLIKDNHIAGYDGDALLNHLKRATDTAREQNLAFVEIEVDTLEQLDLVLQCDVDIVLLDNMTPDQLRRAVQRRNELAPEVQLEASGGVNLDTVYAIAQTGVDRIAVGAITHSAPALDFGLDIAADFS